VYFRAWTRGVANELGLRGTVRNRLDGSVEVHVLGSAGAVSELESRIWEGPAAAKVENVENVPSTGLIENGPFQILSTT
jgi:acylphosphatase